MSSKRTIEEIFEILKGSDLQFLDPYGDLISLKDCSIGEIVVNENNRKVAAYTDSGYNYEYCLPENCYTSKEEAIKDRIKRIEQDIQYHRKELESSYFRRL